MAVITITRTNNSEAFSINSNQIIDVVANGSGSAVRYYNNAQVLESVIVDEAPAAISSSAGNLFSAAVTGGTIYINSNEVIVVTTNGSGCKISYDTKADVPIVQGSTSSRATVVTDINAASGVVRAYGALYRTTESNVTNQGDFDLVLDGSYEKFNITHTNGQATITITESGKYKISGGFSLITKMVPEAP